MGYESRTDVNLSPVAITVMEEPNITDVRRKAALLFWTSIFELQSFSPTSGHVVFLIQSYRPHSSRTLFIYKDLYSQDFSVIH
jgi:hypothetical protein